MSGGAITGLCGDRGEVVGGAVAGVSASGASGVGGVAGEGEDGGEVDLVGVDVEDDCCGDGEADEGVVDGEQSVDLLFGEVGCMSACLGLPG